MKKIYHEEVVFESSPGNNENNLLLAISCNRNAVDFFTPQTLKETLWQASEHAAGLIGILIADKIVMYNNIATNMSEGKALREALKIGDALINNVEVALSELPEELSSRIVVARWNDICTDDYIAEVDNVKSIYHQDDYFREQVDSAARQFIEWRCPGLSKTARRMELFREFIFWELPLFYSGDRGCKMKEETYSGVVYPAINPRGMKIIVGLLKEYAKVNYNINHLSTRKFLVIFDMGRKIASQDDVLL